MRSFKTDAVILCGGKGTRTLSPKNKVLCYFGAKTAIEYCLDALAPFCDKLIVVAAKDDETEIKEIASRYGAETVLGGNTRTQSVKNGLQAATGDIVVIHDAARPFVSADVIERCIRSATNLGSGIAAVKVADTVKRVDGNIIVSEVDRSDLYYMQTPQAFRTEEIKAAYAAANTSFNDDSAVYAAAGHSPVIVESPDSRKITFPSDLLATPPCRKIGTGIDFHRLERGRKLIIGGIRIPFEMGLVGNSDADVLTHAIMDALLSAIGQPDIGVLFPCTEEFKDADSIELLKTVMSKVDESSSKILYVSAVIMAQAPKMMSFIPAMRRRLSSVMGIRESDINISATTTEGLGVIGEGKGIAASATCLLQ